MATRVLRPSRLKTVGWFAACTVFAAIGVLMISAGQLVGLLTAGFFGLGVIVFGALLLPNSAYLRLGPDGFTVCSLFRAHSYRWSDVGPFSVDRVGLNRMVVFNYSDDYRGSPRLRRVAAAMAGYEGALPDSYGMKLEDLADLLNEYRRRR